jgi:hypothetical protein
LINDGLVKSPSAALRFNFVVAAHLASGAFYETIVLATFYEIINSDLKSEVVRPGSAKGRR